MDYPRLLTSQSLIWKSHVSAFFNLRCIVTWGRFIFQQNFQPRVQWHGVGLFVFGPGRMLAQTTCARTHSVRQTHDGGRIRFKRSR